MNQDASRILDGQIINAVRSDQPTTVRHVFYMMVNPSLEYSVKKTLAGYRQVCERILKLRRNGTIPYEYIVDSSRNSYIWDFDSDPGDFIKNYSSYFDLDCWYASNYRVEVWVESESIVSVISDVCRKYQVNLIPTKGFCSETVIQNGAERMCHDGKMPRILYVGDYDPTGKLIDVVLERGLRKRLGDRLEFERIAVNLDQIDSLNLPTDYKKKEISVETETIPSRDMCDLLENKIIENLPYSFDEIRVDEENKSNKIYQIGSYVKDLGIDVILKHLENV